MMHQLNQDANRATRELNLDTSIRSAGTSRPLLDYE